MIHAQDIKFATVFLPQSVATNGTASGTVSCLGFNYATILLHLGTAAASNVDTLLRVSEGDGTTFATNADFSMTTAAPNTSTGQLYAWHLDLRKRKLNLKLEYSGNTNAARLASSTILLSRGEQAPDTNTLRGLAGSVIV